MRIFPPTYLNFLVILEIAAHWIVPIQQIIQTPYTYIGIILIVIGIALNIYSVRYLLQQNTTSSFTETANRLVVTGPFAKSRNPIYLSGVLLSLGIAVFLGSLITFVIPILIFLILNSIHIPDEEKRLEAKFDVEYLAYKQQVRKWI